MTVTRSDAENSPRAGMRARSTGIMLVGIPRQTLVRLAPELQRTEIELVETHASYTALEICAARRFDLVVIRHPVPDMSIDDFLIRLRRPGGRSHRAYALVLTDGSPAESLEQLSGPRSRFANATDFDAVLSVIARNGLGVAPRVEGRLMVQLGLRLEGRRMTRFCQVKNVSESGMLVRTAERPEPGEIVDLTFSLPQVLRPIEVKAQVVRHTGGREIEGVALRFIDLELATRGHLRQYIGEGG